MDKFVIFDSELHWLERKIDSSFKNFSNFLFSIFNLIQKRKNQKKLKIDFIFEIENWKWPFFFFSFEIKNWKWPKFPFFNFQFQIENRLTLKYTHCHCPWVRRVIRKCQFLNRVVRCKTSQLEQFCDSHGKLQLSSMAEKSSVLHLYESLIY